MSSSPLKLLGIKKFTFSGVIRHVDTITGETKYVHKWMYFLDIIKEKLNASVKFNSVDIVTVANSKRLYPLVKNCSTNGTLDFFLNFYSHVKGALYSYKQVDLCYRLAKPPSYTITELILFLPFDK